MGEKCRSRQNISYNLPRSGKKCRSWQNITDLTIFQQGNRTKTNDNHPEGVLLSILTCILVLLP